MPAAEKLHSACDECRSRKMKCSGDKPTCVRCVREGLGCIYSPQKQMGRPKKRRREGEAAGLAQCPVVNHPGESSAFHSTSIEVAQLGYDLTVLPDLPDLDNLCGSTEDSVASTMQQDFDVTGDFQQPDLISLDFDLDTTIDASLWHLPSQSPQPPVPVQPPEPTPCSCLSLTYLTLSTLQSLHNFSFPQIIPPLRTAMSALSTLLHCPTCPLDPFTAIQNIQSITSLFKALTSRFAKAILDINTEATRLSLSGVKKPFRVGDNSPALAHLHTGTLDCPMGFNIELEAREWKKIVKAALRMEVWGGGSGGLCLVGLLGECEQRQRMWHGDKKVWGEEMRYLRQEGEECGEGKGCEALGAEHIRRVIVRFDWE
ncbi:hypothetical protein T440DRAFT_485439 [Plenodomus tracheiphilus IPT5]|uniref:Zn(2)-C6 fungal-type domain-containing protein n=1 Tax=Plenodomus tracheiphilus IPT5 TaxID=1408161 RepID=A0A6A7BLR7_9PLEO|nr:hypothetical protein T440DRAFT_485439 [Plenodomus tracheiphilus IPT5]